MRELQRGENDFPKAEIQRLDGDVNDGDDGYARGGRIPALERAPDLRSRTASRDPSWARDRHAAVCPADDLRRKHARVVPRQSDAGSHRLLEHLLAEADIPFEHIAWLPSAARAETDLAAAIADGRADAGLGIEAAARAHGLAFIPLTIERMDLVIRRRDVFDPPIQTLLTFARSGE